MITLTYSWADDTTVAMHDAFDRAAETWEAVLDIELVEVTGDTDWTIHASDIYGPGAALIGGPDCWIDPSLEQDSGGWGVGTYSFYVQVHELGHLLGLWHPHDYGDASTMLTSAMSYTWITGSNGQNYLNPHEPGIKDIHDLGAIYGYNLTTAGDGTVHRVESEHGIDTVFDAGGEHDLLDLSGLVVGCIVDFGAQLVDLGGNGWAVLSGIEDVRLSQGADTVDIAGGERVYGLTKADLLIVDDDDTIDKLSRREKREEGLQGKWFALDDGAFVQWQGGSRALDKLVVEGE